MKIILASASPRRQELLKSIYPDFEIITSNCEENAPFLSPEQYVMDLSSQKACAVATSLGSPCVISSNPLSSLESFCQPDLLVIGADTIVYHQSKVLGKPQNASIAFDILKCLSGQSHEVYTGVSVFCIKSGANNPVPLFNFAEKTTVHVDYLTDSEINAYIATKDPMDKAGAYGIQGPFGKHITGIEGDYFNVVGLPVSRLYRELKAQHLI